MDVIVKKGNQANQNFKKTTVNSTSERELISFFFYPFYFFLYIHIYMI